MNLKNIIPPDVEGSFHSPRNIAQSIISNPTMFSSRANLLPKIDKLAKKRESSQKSSSHLTLKGISLFSSPILYRDHTGETEEWIYHCAIKNIHNDKAAVETISLVKNIVSSDGHIITTPYNSFLKWVGLVGGYSKTILPETKASFDLLCVSKGNPNYIYLHGATDKYSRDPIIDKQGIYFLKYNVHAEGFPLLKFGIKLFHTGDIETTTLELEIIG